MSVVQILIRDKQRRFLRLIVGGRLVLSQNVESFQQVNTYGKPCRNPYTREFSTVRPKSRLILLSNLERALNEHETDKAWEAYRDFKGLYGFPNPSVLVDLISKLSYSSDSKCLRRACHLALVISKQKSFSLKSDVLTKLALSLSRAQIPLSTSRILRIMLEKGCLPSLDVLRMIFLHLVKTRTGTYLASNILEEISYSQKESRKMPDVMIFNLVLDACVRFRTPLKGQQIIEVMAELGVIADAHSAVIIARLHEMNGLSDELKKFKPHVDILPVSLARHYQQFYSCLLSLHFKFNDIEGASALLLDLCRHKESDHFPKGWKEGQKICMVSIGSQNIQTGLKLQFLPQQLQRDFVCKTDKLELLMYQNGKYVLSNKGLAKVIVLYKRAGRITDFSKVVAKICNMLSSPEDVINSCIYLGWLETAHDIIDDLESENYPIQGDLYASLLTAYHKKHMFKEAEGLRRQINRVGLVINDLPDNSNSKAGKTDLANLIIQNVTDEDDYKTVLEYNSSIYFFAKAKMIEDAKRTYSKMQKSKIQPNSATYFHLISGYYSLGMYSEVTILWGDIKRYIKCSNMVCDQDLHEMLLLSFIRGGYFERVMEVIGFMMGYDMFLDKWKYKNEFLKFHRDLYRNLAASDAKDDMQSKRIELVKAFRKWARIG